MWLKAQNCFVTQCVTSKNYHSTRPTFEARRELARYTHTNGNRAEAQEVYKRHIPQVTECRLNSKEFEIAENNEQMKQPKEKKQLYQDSPKQNLIREDEISHILGLVSFASQLVRATSAVCNCCSTQTSGFAHLCLHSCPSARTRDQSLSS